ncbi:MAG: DNA adenine methylase [Nitrospiraceae bacterium]
MARSSTTFLNKWRNGRTSVIRVPTILSKKVISYAIALDSEVVFLQKETEGVYRTAGNVQLDAPINVAAVPQRSPFRYPGGKTWLVPYVRTWLSKLSKTPDVLIEPFAGGGIVGLTAGFEQLANHVVLAEKDENIASVWAAILCGQSEWLADTIENFNLTRRNVLAVLGGHPTTQREKAFATILRNRVQRGGIMAPGAGLVKNGENGRGLNSRWYPQTLAKRIRSIAALRQRFSFSQRDGFEIIEAYRDDSSAAFFVDPPYTKAARRLYQHWQIDHRKLFSLLSAVKGDVLLTYDRTAEIEALAKEFGFETESVTMKNTHHAHMTELLVGKNLSWLSDAITSRESTSRIHQESLALHL